MVDEAFLKEYLEEIRQQVCSCCDERPAGGPPCAPHGINCGVEQHLAELLGSIHGDLGDAVIPGLEQSRFLISRACACLECRNCPCPATSHGDLLVQAAATVEQRHNQWECLKKFQKCKFKESTSRLAELHLVYEETADTLIGCD